MRSIQQQIEEVPAGHAVGAFGPDVWAVDASIASEAAAADTLQKEPGILLVVAYKRHAFPSSLGGERGEASRLRDVGSAVEERALTSVP